MGTFSKSIGYIFWILISTILCLFLLSQVLDSHSNYLLSISDVSYNDGWSILHVDGTSTLQEIPANLDVEAGTPITIWKVLPDEIKDNSYLCFRSSQQDAVITIDGNVRMNYAEREEYLFGKTSVSRFLMVELKEEDAGKEVYASFMTEHNQYAGYLNYVYYGTQWDIYRYVISEYGFRTVMALFVCVIGFLIICVSFVLKRIYHVSNGLDYLGIFSVMLSLWILCESRLKQFYFTNLFYGNLLAFILLILLPIPLMYFFDHLQSFRYSKYYHVMSVIVFLYFALATSLQVMDVVDYITLLPISVGLIMISLLVILWTLVEDIRSKYYSDSKMVFLALLELSIFAVLEVIDMSSIKVTALTRCISAGMIFFLLLVAGSSIHRLFVREREREKELEKNRTTNAIFANISHELRAPIGAMLGMNELILRESGEEDVKEYARVIQRSGNMLLGIINDILDLSSLEAGKLYLAHQKYDMTEVLQDVYQLLIIKAEHKGLDLQYQIGADVPRLLLGDEVRIKQILINLIGNGIKYVEKGYVRLQVILLECNERNCDLLFVVEDSGPGIKKEDIPTLVHRFVRLEEGVQRSAEGTGLGLAITGSLLEMMNSKLDIRSDYGKGSTFSFVLTQEMYSQEKIGEFHKEREEYEKEMELVPILSIPGKRILVVDDNPVNLVITKGLLRNSMAEVDVAQSGKECLQMTAVKEYHMILLDQRMPHMNGEQVMEEIRHGRNSINRRVPLVAFTAGGMDATEYIKMGYDDVLAKPIVAWRFNELLRKHMSAQGDSDVSEK